MIFAFLVSLSAATLPNNTMLIMAASLVEMAQQDGKITEEEHNLLKNKFPLNTDTDPVAVFTLDKSNLPSSVASLSIDIKQKESFLHLLGLVSIIDGKISQEEMDYLLRHKEAQKDNQIQQTEIKTYLKQSRKLLNRIQHEPVLETMKAISASQMKYHKRYKRFFSASLCPNYKSDPAIEWETCKTQYSNFPWVTPTSVTGSYKIEGSKSAFVITGVVDIDGDGQYATYVSTHSNPTPKRMGNQSTD